jgi:hypothetical protein
MTTTTPKRPPTYDERPETPMNSTIVVVSNNTKPGPEAVTAGGVR